MISGKDIYDVLAALVPLYVAMTLAYASVRWWKIFTPDQCSGINRFVAVFAVPLLSFEYISSNDPYLMNLRFLAADSIQKISILVALILWNTFAKHSSLDWVITMFSVSTLPNTLVIGIPLLKSMYGDFSGSLMVQIVVLQSVIWYTVILFMFEYRAAKILISKQFPENAKSITSFKVDSDIVSLGSKETLEADSEIGDDGKVRVVVRKSNPSSLGSHSNNYCRNSMTPTASNLTGIEIYSLKSSQDPTPRVSGFNQADLSTMFPGKASRNGMQSNGYGGNTYSRQSSKGATEMSKLEDEKKKKGWRSKSTGSFSFGVSSNSAHAPPNAGAFSESNSCGASKKDIGGSACNEDLHMFGWSRNGSTNSEGNRRHSVNRGASPEFGSIDLSKIVPHETAASELGGHELTENRKAETEGGSKLVKGGSEHMEGGINANTKKEMPPAGVITRLILVMVWRRLVRNPNTYASFLGLAWALISFRLDIQMPTIVRGSISMLSKAGLGLAMFSIGLFMGLQPKLIACGKSVAAISMTVRFLGGPATMAAASAAIGIRGVFLQIAIVQAALPQAIVPFVFAKEYDVHADIVSTGVIFGMLIALPITLVYYALLGL